jgi:hypothetical protein
MTLLKNFHFLAPILAFFALFFVDSFLAGPINVRIETDNAQDFHIGPEPRTRFELVEQYSPLATAKLATGVGKDGQQQPGKKNTQIFGEKNIFRQIVQIIKMIDFVFFKLFLI